MFSLAMKRRCEQLRVLLSMLDEMSARIRYSSVRMNELLTDLSGREQYAGSPFVTALSRELDGGMTSCDAWCAAAGTAAFLDDTDRQILSDIGAKLGGTDTDGQLSMLALGSSQLGRQLEAAENDVSQKSRTVMSVWTLCGIGAGILLI